MVMELDTHAVETGYRKSCHCCLSSATSSRKPSLTPRGVRPEGLVDGKVGLESRFVQPQRLSTTAWQYLSQT